MMHSRNSCKTLKCPKCNWHYKYQETLEIHMKEKHPDTEQTCIYCVTKQSHPKLARGESYMCGYKPYRCEVCNYSTTTKGNLSIHMQSDKHINNMQEIQSNGGSLSSPTVVKLPLFPGLGISWLIWSPIARKFSNQVNIMNKGSLLCLTHFIRLLNVIRKLAAAMDLFPSIVWWHGLIFTGCGISSLFLPHYSGGIDLTSSLDRCCRSGWSEPTEARQQ